MYESFYGFQEKPFSLLPDPDFLFLSKEHRRALAILEFGALQEAAVTVLTGEIGAGKTTLIRRLLQVLPADLNVGLVSNTDGSFEDLLRWVLLGFGREYRQRSCVELYQAVADFIAIRYSQGVRTVLIIDEAQNLGVEALEELRMLSNMNTGTDLLLQLVLVGQPPLRGLLRCAQLRQFAQRVVVDHHLRSMDLAETCQYIWYRLAKAGGEMGLFDYKACTAVYYYTRGTPRLINVLCDMALVYAYGQQKRRIDMGVICEVVHDHRVRGGLLPLWGNKKKLRARRVRGPDRSPQETGGLRNSSGLSPWRRSSL
jgi:type II secretory pathway predicted ATPase ExeA